MTARVRGVAQVGEREVGELRGADAMVDEVGALQNLESIEDVPFERRVAVAEEGGRAHPVRTEDLGNRWRFNRAAEHEREGHRSTRPTRIHLGEANPAPPELDEVRGHLREKSVVAEAVDRDDDDAVDLPGRRVGRSGGR